METIAILLLIGVAAYFILRHTTERGTNTVRAYLYLRAINRGASVQAANQMAQINLTNGSHHIPDAKEYVRIAYDGKQLVMIEEARKSGFLLNGLASRTQATAKTPSHYPAHTVDVAHALHAGFDTYDAICMAEVKRLSGKKNTDLHWLELTDDTARRRAFSDGIEPKALALELHTYATPPPIDRST